MATLFSSIAVRENGQKILYSWFNALRSAGISLESFLGSGYIAETSFTIANNQSSPANVTGLLFDSSSYRSVLITAEVRRKSTGGEVISFGHLKLIYRVGSATWELIDELSGDDDDVEFTVTSGGQVQYTSNNMTGTGYTGTMKFRAITTGA